MFRFRAPEIWLAAILLAAAVVIVETAALAQGASPLSFLEQTYKVYRSNSSSSSSNARGIDTGKPEVIRRHFVPALAKAMIKDRADARKRNEGPLLNGDPFIDAQGWEIADLRIEMVPGATRRNATGVVSFTSAGEPRQVSLDLVRTGDGWRIHDIKAPSGSLRELYKVR